MSDKQASVRIPIDLIERIDTLATLEKRSRTQQVEWNLEQAVKDAEYLHGLADGEEVKE